jgi:hypothetical protein
VKTFPRQKQNCHNDQCIILWLLRVCSSQKIVDMCVPNIEIFDTLSTFVNDEQKMDGNFCLFIIFTVLMVAIKRVLSVLEKLSHPNNCYADIVHSSSSGFVVGSNYYHLKQPTSVVIVGVSQTFC